MLVVGCQAAHFVPPQRFTFDADPSGSRIKGNCYGEEEEREVRLTQKLSKNIQTGIKTFQPAIFPFRKT
jgi:hypothetical protein